MIRYNGYKRRKTNNKCKYCERIAATGDMCDICRKKLPLVRKLITIGNMIKEQAAEERQQRQEMAPCQNDSIKEP